MRILHLIDSDGIYGAEQILLYLARETQRRGDQCILGSIRQPGTPATPLEDLARSWGLEVLPIRVPPRPTPSVIRELLRAVRSVQPDVLHSHGYKANILLGRVPRGIRGPMMATLHGWTEQNSFSALWVYQRIDRFCMRALDAVVVVGQPMLKLPGIRSLREERRVIIENGIPPLQERLADQQSAGVAALPAGVQEFIKRRPTIVAVGRLSPEKGFDLLIDAFAAAAGDTGAQLLLIGDGPEREALAAKIAGHELTDAIMLAGYVEAPDRTLAHAAGFVMSSFTEGLPIVLLEALQWQVPIVATAVGAIPDVLKAVEVGDVVPPRDRNALSAALGRMLRSTTRPKAPAKSLERYLSARMAEDYAQLYRRIVAR